MFVARDEDNTLHLFDGEIIRVTDNCPFGYWQIPHGYFNSSMQLNEKLFPDLKWENEPLEVTIVSKKIDEEKLDELAKESKKNISLLASSPHVLEKLISYESGYKAGYRKRTGEE